MGNISDPTCVGVALGPRCRVLLCLDSEACLGTRLLRVSTNPVLFATQLVERGLVVNLVGRSWDRLQSRLRGGEVSKPLIPTASGGESSQSHIRAAETLPGSHAR